MVTKKFKAPNMLAALQEVQKSLGSEAIVVSMRQIPAGPAWQVWKQPGCEVIASLPDKPTAPAETPVAPKSKIVGSAAAQTATKPNSRETIEWVIPNLDKHPGPIETKTPVKPAPAPAPQPAAARPAAQAPSVAPAVTAQAESQPYIPAETTLLGKTRSRLLNQGVDTALVDQIVTICRDSLSPGSLIDEKRLLPYMQKQFEIRIRTLDKALVNSPRRIICLVGTSGSGKTSACAKLASYYSMQEGKTVAWIGADTIRTAAISETRMYTESLGIALYTAYTAEDVKFSLQQAANADIILIDTPGCNPLDEASLVEMGSLIADIPGRITLLVTPATTKESDLNQAIAVFGSFNLKGLFMTKMDETTTFGSLFNIAWKNQIPVAYYSAGSKVLESLKQGSPAYLTNAMFNAGVAR
jgi:flagellar biosynthesis protein FlhF